MPEENQLYKPAELTCYTDIDPLSADHYELLCLQVKHTVLAWAP